MAFLVEVQAEQRTIRARKGIKYWLFIWGFSWLRSDNEGKGDFTQNFWEKIA